MKIFKKGISLIIMTAVILSTAVIPASAFTKPASIAIDGKGVSVSAFTGAPYIDLSNRLQVPIAVVSKNLGAKVTWNGSTKTAIINGKIRIKVGAKEIKTNYETIKMDTSSVLKAGRIYVPVRFICQALGYKVVADSSSRTANIITKAELTLSAAASLKDALAEIKTLYLAEKPHTNLIINLGSSGALSQQIEQGAEVDLFFPAATTNMTTLKDKGLLDNSTVKNLLGNKLVLIVPKDSKLAIKSFADVLDPAVKRIALGEPKSVPVGQYAEDVFTKLNTLAKVKEKAVYGKDVKEVLTWVETGNVDAGVVYSTDAKVSSKAKVIATAPADSHKPIIYPVAVIKTTKSPIVAQDFLNFLSSDKAKAVFVKYGFSIL